MARLNEILVGRYARALQKLFGVKGDVPVATLAPEIMPVHIVPSGVENRYLDGWERFGVTIGQVAVAASLGGLQIRNPSTSNVIAVLEKITWNNNGAAADRGALFFKPTGAVDLATTSVPTNVNLDTRGRSFSSLTFSQASPASVAGYGGVAAAGAGIGGNYDFIFDIDQELPLLPGSAYLLQSQTVNNALAVTWLWRERFLEESERT